MEDNKPLETDSEETSDETLDELFDDQESKDDTTEGGEDVKEASFFTKEEFEQIAGRTFKDKEDLKKHYVNLKSKVGALPPKVEKKIEPAIEVQIPNELLAVKEEWEEFKFVRKAPDAEKHIDLIRSIAKGDKIPLDKAYEKVKSYLDASETQAKEKEIAIESKNRIAPQERQKRAAALKRFQEEDSESAKQELVSEFLGIK